MRNDDWSNVRPGTLRKVAQYTSKFPTEVTPTKSNLPASASSKPRSTFAPYVIGILLGCVIAAAVSGLSIARKKQNSDPLSCQQTQSLFANYANGALLHSQRLQVKTHLAGCEDCSRLFEEQYGGVAHNSLESRRLFADASPNSQVDKSTNGRVF